MSDSDTDESHMRRVQSAGRQAGRSKPAQQNLCCNEAHMDASVSEEESRGGSLRIVYRNHSLMFLLPQSVAKLAE